jgi:sulfonate transport system permease protein
MNGPTPPLDVVAAARLPQRAPARSGRTLSRAVGEVRDAALEDAQDRSGRLSGWTRVALGAVPPVVAIAVAEVAARRGWVSANLFPSPSTIVETIADLADHGLAAHVAASVARVAVGFVAGTLLAFAAGTLVGLLRRAEALLEPSFQALRAIPSLAWVPLLLWLGIDEAPKLVLIGIGAFFPIYLGVASGFRDVDRKLIEVAAVYGPGRFALIRRVLFPAALPAICTGLRNGLSLAWMFMVAAELIAASRGLGYLLTDGRETGRADIVLAVIVILAVLGKLSDGAMKFGERRLLAWRDTFDARDSRTA